MYWPIGAPRVYAADVEHHYDHRSSLSEDGLEDRPAESVERGNGGRPVLGSGNSEEGRKLEKSGTVSEASITTNGYRSSEAKGRASSKSTPKEPLIGLRVSRNGQMFATITASTLTLWQTRASGSQTMTCGGTANSTFSHQ